MSQRPLPSWTTPAHVTRVIDGDTIEVKVERTLRIRLLNCWAPETRTKDLAEKARGLEAKEALKELFRKTGQDVMLRIPTEGEQALAAIITLGRFLGEVWLADGRNVSEVMVERGLASVEKE